jgi:ligand-binding sensor domain-containing protein/serine phosphatase RsbU (regulator of sigma subunit)
MPAQEAKEKHKKKVDRKRDEVFGCISLKDKTKGDFNCLKRIGFITFTIMLSRIRGFLLFIVCFCNAGWPDAQAQSNLVNHAVIRNIIQDEGLTTSFVNCMIQDRSHILWIGTQEGLNKYDGYNFQTFQHKDGNPGTLANNFITQILQDRNGLIWLGLMKQGVDCLDPITERIVHYELSAGTGKNRKIFTTVNSMCEDPWGGIWVTTREGAILRKTAGQNRFVLMENEMEKLGLRNTGTVNLVCHDQKIFAGFFSKKGLVEFSWNAKRELGYRWLHPKLDGLDSLGAVTRMCSDPRGYLWLFENGVGIWRFNPQTLSIQKIESATGEPVHAVNRMLVDHNLRFWVATENDGLLFLERLGEKLQSFDRDMMNGGKKIKWLIQDYQQNLWLAVFGGGLVQLKFNQTSFRNFFSSLKVEENIGISGLYVDSQGGVWVGTAQKGMRFINRSFKSAQIDALNKELNSEVILSMCEVPGNHMLIGTASGLYDVEMNTLAFNRINLPQDFSNAAISGIAFRNGRVFLTVYGYGLCYFDRSPNGVNAKIVYRKNNAQLRRTNDIDVNSVSFLRNGYCLVNGYNQGLTVYNAQMEWVRSVGTEAGHGLASNTAYLALEDSKGRVWVSSGGMGLDVVLNSDALAVPKAPLNVVHISTEDGLCNNSVYGLLEDHSGNIWASTNLGLCRISSVDELLRHKMKHLNVSKEKVHRPVLSHHFKTFLMVDGLPSNEFNFGAFAKNLEGRLFFGGLNGVTSIMPDSIMTNLQKPRIIISSFRLFGKEPKLDTNIVRKQQITLNYNQNFFSFEFSALNFILTEKNQFAYRMEGYDQDWVYAGARRFASYTNLDHGEYLFRVKACNNDGIWNDQGTSLRIIITPPFYKTKWFYTLVILLIIGLIYAYIRFREKQLVRENVILEEKVAIRTRQIAEINKEISKKNQDITDSINYARRIQQAILVPEQEIRQSLKGLFLFYKPKDIVSGDFYWFQRLQDQQSGQESYLLAVADCTGHGVPGAFMSMIGIDLLNDLVKRTQDPGRILEYLNRAVKEALRQSDQADHTRDGMDIALCLIRAQAGGGVTLLFAGANRPMWIVPRGQTVPIEIKSTKAAIGGFTEENQVFNTEEISVSTGDSVYFFTDGYLDQFGGEHSKKFMVKRFRQLVGSIAHKAPSAQVEGLHIAFEQWRQKEEQVDDILVMGFVV